MDRRLRGFCGARPSTIFSRDVEGGRYQRHDQENTGPGQASRDRAIGLQHVNEGSRAMKRAAPIAAASDVSRRADRVDSLKSSIMRANIWNAPFEMSELIRARASLPRRRR